MRQNVILRISLTFAAAAALAAVAMIQFQLRPQMRNLGEQRDEFKRLADQRLARAIKAETNARELAQQLAAAQKSMDAAVLENKQLAESKARAVVSLEETRTELHTVKQELARWKATGATPDQVAYLAAENKRLTTRSALLEKDKQKLQSDNANLKEKLVGPVDEDAIPELPPLKGSVLVVDSKWHFVVLDIGEGTGLKRNGVLIVNRDGKPIAKVKVRRVDSERSIADILPDWRLSEVREGDQVIN